MSEEKPQISRRTAVKIISATGVAAVMAGMRGWKKPSLTAGVLPAFAQASQGLGTGDLQVTLTWNTGDAECGQNRTDMDLHVWEPGGTHVYFDNMVGVTATQDVDNVCGFGPENIYVPPGDAASGTYYVGIVHWYGLTFPTTSTVRIRVFADTPGENSASFNVVTENANPSYVYPVAQVQFPSGTISSWAGPVPTAFTSSMKITK